MHVSFNLAESVSLSLRAWGIIAAHVLNLIRVIFIIIQQLSRERQYLFESLGRVGRASERMVSKTFSGEAVKAAEGTFHTKARHPFCRQDYSIRHPGISPRFSIQDLRMAVCSQSTLKIVLKYHCTARPHESSSFYTLIILILCFTLCRTDKRLSFSVYTAPGS